MEEVEITNDGWVRVELPDEGYTYVRPSLVTSVSFNIAQGAYLQLINGAIYKILEEPQSVVERLELGAKRERKAARP